MENTVLECIKSRRSVRQYMARKLTKAQIQTLLEAAVWAPSGSNHQSWQFTAIQNKDILSALNEVVKSRLPYIKEEMPAQTKVKARCQESGYNFYYNAPVLIVASNIPHYPNAMADCALALQNIFLVAQEMGLGSCWINQLHWLEEDPAVRDFLSDLGIARERVICGAAAVGYPANRPQPPARKPGTTWII